MKSSVYVSRIMCDGCIASITNELNQVKGMQQVEVDKLSGKVQMEHQFPLEIKAIKEQLKALGYPEKVAD